MLEDNYIDKIMDTLYGEGKEEIKLTKEELKETQNLEIQLKNLDSWDSDSSPISKI